MGSQWIHWLFSNFVNMPSYVVSRNPNSRALFSRETQFTVRNQTPLLSIQCYCEWRHCPVAGKLCGTAGNICTSHKDVHYCVSHTIRVRLQRKCSSLQLRLGKIIIKRRKHVDTIIGLQNSIRQLHYSAEIIVMIIIYCFIIQPKVLWLIIHLKLCYFFPGVRLTFCFYYINILHEGRYDETR